MPFAISFLFAVVSEVGGAFPPLDSTTALPHHSSSSETCPKKRKKTVGFVGDPEGPLTFDNDKETRPESSEDTVETETTEAHFESHQSSISHFVPTGSPNLMCPGWDTSLCL